MSLPRVDPSRWVNASALALGAGLCMLADPQRTGVLTLCQVRNVVGSQTMEVGRPVPAFAAWAADGKPVRLVAKGRRAVVVFSSCDCQRDVVQRWLAAAGAEGAGKILLSPSKPDELGRLRFGDLRGTTLGSVDASVFAAVANTEAFPVACHVDGDGIVTAIDRLPGADAPKAEEEEGCSVATPLCR